MPKNCKTYLISCLPLQWVQGACSLSMAMTEYTTLVRKSLLSDLAALICDINAIPILLGENRDECHVVPKPMQEFGG